MTRKIIFIFFLCFVNCQLSTVTCFAQAYQFTQFYAAPTFLNPAFTGVGACQRLTTNYRIQWPSVPGAYRTYLLAFDHYLPRKKSGVGFLFSNDKAGSGNLRSTSFNGQYSYQVTLTRKWAFNAGFEAGFTTRNYDFDKFVFGDQLAYGTPTSVESRGFSNVTYFDLASGILFYSDKNWIGVAAHHLNQPNQALVSETSRLPVLYSVHAGRKIPMVKRGVRGKSVRYFTPAFNYRAEKKFDQLDIGFYYANQAVTVGLWYRGIPLFKAYKTGYQNNDALALLAGCTIERFKFGYSYDITISRLSGVSGNAHEISLSYQFCRWRRKSSIPCPKF